MKTLIKIAIFLTPSLLLLGCASEPKASDYKAVEQKTTQETQVKTRADLKTESEKLIESSALTPEQKTQLKDLRTKMSTDLDANSEKSLQLRSLLIKEILTSEYNSKEVRAIEKNMRKLSEDRLQTIFKGVREANKIIGRNEERKKLLEDMMQFETDQLRRNQ